MAHVGLSITKRVTYRDSTQDFSNVYHYWWPGLDPSASLAESVIDAIVALEKANHATSVSFVYARLWSAGGSVSDNQMIFQKSLTGTGSASSDNSIDRERAVLIQWPLGTDSLGRPTYLRKWYHLLAASAFGVAISTSMVAQFSGFSAGQRSTMGSNADSFTSPFVGALEIFLCSPSAELPTQQPTAHRYLEHRQLGDQWR